MKFRNILKKLLPVSSSNDIKPFDKAFELDQPVYGVYHIYMSNDWMSLVKEQLESLTNSGLASVTDMLFISCVYQSEDDLQCLMSLVPPPFRQKVKIVKSLQMQHNEFEFPALEYIRERALIEEFYVYYFHTKGVSYTANNLQGYPTKQLEKLRMCSRAWRKMMEYFVFYKHNIAINVLKEYDTYGCAYISPLTHPHHYKYYAGNFWWSKSSYIRTLPQISDNDKKNRYWAENYLLLKTDKYFSTFNTPVQLYTVEIPMSLYNIETKTNMLDLIKFTYQHFSFIFQKQFIKCVI